MAAADRTVAAPAAVVVLPVGGGFRNARHAPRRTLSAVRRAAGFPCKPITAERREQLKWLFPVKSARPQRARAAHRTGRVVRSAAAVATSAAGGTPASDGSSSDGDGEPEPDPAPVVRLPPSPAAFALADVFACILADLLTSGAIAPSSDSSPYPFTAATSRASRTRHHAARPGDVRPRAVPTPSPTRARITHKQ